MLPGLNIEAKEKHGARVHLALLSDLQFSHVGKTDLSSWTKQEGKLARKDIMPVEFIWNTDSNMPASAQPQQVEYWSTRQFV